MKVAHVASEVTPWSQSGGLGDVTAALPQAQSADGVEVAVFSPLYRRVNDRARARGVVLSAEQDFEVQLGSRSFSVTIRRAQTGPGPALLFVDVPQLYDRDGLYGDRHGDYQDNAVRFAVLARAAIAGAREALGGPPDVMHAHDWQAGLVPLWAECPSVFTIHNLAYRGLFHRDTIHELGLDWSLFTLDELEFYDQVSFLKAGVARAQAVTTVSPSYAAEILTPEFGQGLDEFLAHHALRLVGILNGIDADAWNPETDSAIAANYSAGDLSGKAICRQALVQELGPSLQAGAMLVGVVSRFAEQKGLDLVAELVELLPAQDATPLHIIILGTGDPALEDRLRALARARPTILTLQVGFDLALARRIYAGCDAFLMPSRSEPCGLSQLYAMRYGTLPIVHRVGGLRDTVDTTRGFCFEHADLGGIRWAVERASDVFANDPAQWREMMRAGMRRDWSWAGSARSYLELYRQLRLAGESAP